MSEKVSRWNVLFIISAVIGLIYTIFIISYMANTGDSGATSAEQIGISIAMAMIFPHVVVVVVSVILNFVTVFTNSTVLGLLTGIFYSVSGLLMPIYILFVAAPIVLSWIGYVQLRKRNQKLENLSFPGAA